MKRIQIVKTKHGKILIGQAGAVKEGIKLNIPFEIRKTKEGVTITPYDVEMIDTYIPSMNIYEYEYAIEPAKQLADFYTNSSDVFIKEIKERNTPDKEEE